MKWNGQLKMKKKVRASPKEIAICPLCEQEVIAKCGNIKVWHWSHKQDFECDTFGEPETEWHKEWKDYFPKECQEVVLEHPVFSEDGCSFPKKHRADVYTLDEEVIELQNSPITPEQIIEREEFYDNMVWIINGKNLCGGMNLRIKDGYLTFRWKHPSQSWWYAKKNIYIDFGLENLFLIKKIYPKLPCGGWGILVNKEEFINGRKGKQS